MTVVSTGTWIVGLSDNFDPAALSEARGMTCNADVHGRPLAGALTMGGREFSKVADPSPSATPADPVLIARLIERDTMALPSFGNEDGLFPGSATQGRITGPAPTTPEERRALAVLYTALLTSVCLEALRSEKLVILDGSFVRDPLYAALVAAFRPNHPTLFNLNSQGTAAGSALLANSRDANRPRPDPAGKTPSAELAPPDGLPSPLARPRTANKTRKTGDQGIMETTTQDLRREMVETCRQMNATGINQGTAGNLSVRTGDGFLITPSSLPYDRMQPEDLVEMSFDGTYTGRRPSSEWRFHRDILRQRTDIDVVLHCHSIFATTLACHHKTIPSFHYMTGVAGGTTIRCAKYATFGTQQLSDYALEALEDRLACLLGQHGQISLGKTLESALWLANEVETLSRMYVHALTLGDPPILPDDEMARVIEQMRRMSYGQAPDLDGINDVARPRQAS